MFALLASASARTPSGEVALPGRWAGTLDVAGRLERVVVDFVRLPGGSLRGALNVPRDRVLGKPLRDLQVADDRVGFDVPIVDGVVRFALHRRAAALRGVVTSPRGRSPLESRDRSG